MMVEAVQGIQMAGATAPDAGHAPSTPTGSFGAVLDKLEQDEVRVQSNLAQYIQGGSSTPVHEIMLDIERNRLMLSLALQVRNKLVEGVQELLRTPI